MFSFAELRDLHLARAAEFLAALPPAPADREGRGIVIPAGGETLFTCGYVAARLLRHHGCELPIQFWHFPGEISARQRELAQKIGVECIDARAIEARTAPRRILNGWELKAFAILHCPFHEVLLLDADNHAIRDPTYLFGSAEYLAAGAVFWPDFGRLGRERRAWEVFGVRYRDEPEVESGQILVDVVRCWRPLQLVMHYGDHSDWYYQHVHGDKETFHLAWRRLEAEGFTYAMPTRGIVALDSTMCQHDFEGQRVFQHRNFDKWRRDGSNKRIEDFWWEPLCRRFLADLRTASRSA